MSFIKGNTTSSFEVAVDSAYRNVEVEVDISAYKQSKVLAVYIEATTNQKEVHSECKEVEVSSNMLQPRLGVWLTRTFRRQRLQSDESLGLATLDDLVAVNRTKTSILLVPCRHVV